MGYSVPKTDEVNILVSQADWAWPVALKDIFEPRGINMLLAKDTDDCVGIIEHRRIQTAIIDMNCEKANGLVMVKVIRNHFPHLPCILLSRLAEKNLLSQALRLDIFSVIDKPVDMSVLLWQLNRLFTKKYNSEIFSK